MEPRKLAIILLAVGIVLTLTYAFYTSASEIAHGAYPYPHPESPKPFLRDWSLFRDRVYMALASYGVAAIITLALTLTTRETAGYLPREIKPRVEYLYYGFAFSTVGLFAMTVALAVMAALHRDPVITLGGISFSPHSVAIPVATYFATVGLFFYYIAVHTFVRGEPPGAAPLAVTATPMVLVWLLDISPYNWFGVEGPRGAPNIRIYSNALLLLYYVIVIVQMEYWLATRSRMETGGEKKFRLRLMMASFLLLAGFFLSYLVEAVLDLGPYSFIMGIAFFFLISSFVALYLGLVYPKWFADFASKRLGMGATPSILRR